MMIKLTSRLIEGREMADCLDRTVILNHPLIRHHLVVNFINMFTRSFYRRRSQKCKRVSSLQCQFAHLGSLRAKSAHKTLVKSTRGVVDMAKNVAKLKITELVILLSTRHYTLLNMHIQLSTIGYNGHFKPNT